MIVLILGIVVGLVAGLAMGGRIRALANAPLRFAALIAAAVVLRYGTQVLIANGVEIVDLLRLPLYSLAFAVLIAALWLNRASPGLLVVMVGVALNATALLVNGGWMPVYLPSLAAAGLGTEDLLPTYHVALPTELGLEFLRMAGPLGDVFPVPIPAIANVLSLGDIFISVGLGWFVFATLLWGEPEPEAAGVSLWRGRAHTGPLLDRPLVLGGGMGPGLALPGTGGVARGGEGAVPRPAGPRRSVSERVRAHPYVRLARDARFSAFWISQTISVFGDRLNQLALGVMVLSVTDSALATGLVYLCATLPNLLLGPIAGTFVDRWDHKRVMVVSDLLRAGLVLIIPLAAEVSILTVYPLVFLVTTVSLFFRPARSAIVPRIVREQDLMSANGAIWTGETAADIAGYPFAGILVAMVGTSLAFWIDAATYLVSAILIAGLVIPPVIRSAQERIGSSIDSFASELRDGWRFLRRQPALFQNTMVSTLGQLSIGATLALTVVFARDLLGGRMPDGGEPQGLEETFGAIEAAIGLGNLLGGFAVGLLGTRLRKGWLVVTGFTMMGIATVAMGLAAGVEGALVSAFLVGVFNLVYVIPSQTLFGELVPPELMGRVVAIRSSIVFGAMTLSMAVSSACAETVPAGAVIAALGVVTVIAGLIGAALPAVRDA